MRKPVKRNRSLENLSTDIDGQTANWDVRLGRWICSNVHSQPLPARATYKHYDSWGKLGRKAAVRFSLVGLTIVGLATLPARCASDKIEDNNRRYPCVAFTWRDLDNSPTGADSEVSGTLKIESRLDLLEGNKIESRNPVVVARINHIIAEHDRENPYDPRGTTEEC